MEYITTTDLRTKSSQLVKTLQGGGSLTLIHRSKVIGKIEPAIETVKPFDIEKFKKALEAIRPKKIIPKSQREKIYRKHLEEKYGKGLL